MKIDVSNYKYTDVISINENSILYLKPKFENFDINKFNITFEELEEFDIKYSFSYDNINWSNPVIKENWDLYVDSNEIDGLSYVYISIWFFKKIKNQYLTNTINITENNINTKEEFVIISKISYNNEIINILDEKLFNLVTYHNIVNKLPKWNFYDNQQLNIRRWLDQCISISQMFGHTVIYFKTEPTETNHTFANHVLRNVVSIKRFNCLAPGNELPQDRNIYSEWDMSLEGDFILHVVDEVFKQAFGENKVPISKDYLFLPIINKLFRVSSVQPKNGFMGKIGWWEVFLSKFEDDETIGISSSLKEIYSGIENFDFDENFPNIEVLEEIDEFLEDKIISKEKLQEKNIDEKKEVTENFTNVLIDSNRYVDLKETDAQRKFYEKRLNIISINPDENAFPVTMYDCSTVDKRVIALTYDVENLVSINKKSRIIDDLEFSFNFVLLNKFSGEIFDFNPMLFTIEFNRQNLSINFNKYQKNFKIDYKFEFNEYYQINIKYNQELKQLSVLIIMLKNSQKNIVYQNIYIINTNNLTNDVINNYSKMELKNIYLFGGLFYINELLLKINDNKILSDNVNPVLIMNQFGLQS